MLLNEWASLSVRERLQLVESLYESAVANPNKLQEATNVMDEMERRSSSSLSPPPWSISSCSSVSSNKAVASSRPGSTSSVFVLDNNNNDENGFAHASNLLIGASSSLNSASNSINSASNGFNAVSSAANLAFNNSPSKTLNAASNESKAAFDKSNNALNEPNAAFNESEGASNKLHTAFNDPVSNRPNGAYNNDLNAASNASAMNVASAIWSSIAVNNRVGINNEPAINSANVNSVGAPEQAAQNSNVDEDLAEALRQSLDPVHHVNSDDQALLAAIRLSKEQEERRQKRRTRVIVVDGNNVAYGHGNQQVFSAQGLLLCQQYFMQELGIEFDKFVIFATEGHGMSAADRKICQDLRSAGILHWVHKRRVAPDCYIAPHDDLQLLDYANRCEGIVVSNDKFRDVLVLHPEFEEQIKRRVMTYTFVRDMFLVPMDPLGRNGPSLEEFITY